MSDSHGGQSDTLRTTICRLSTGADNRVRPHLRARQNDGMDAALDILGLVAVVGFVAALSRRVNFSEPLALVIVGVGISFIPHLLEVVLTPDIVLIGLLPPLLYAAAIRTSLVDFRANRRAIGLLSVGLVAFSTVAIGFVAWWAVPGIPLAA